MSSGSFIRTTYEISGIPAATCRISVQSETLDAAAGGEINISVSGAPTLQISAQVRGTKRTLGIVARIVYLKLPISTIPPNGYVLGTRTAIPALTSAFFSECLRTGFCTYLGILWDVTGGRAETLR